MTTGRIGSSGHTFGPGPVEKPAIDIVRGQRLEAGGHASLAGLEFEPDRQALEAVDEYRLAHVGVAV